MKIDISISSVQWFETKTDPDFSGLDWFSFMNFMDCFGSSYSQPAGIGLVLGLL